MLKVLLNGCGGRMGRVISEIVKDSNDMEITAGCDLNPPENLSYPVFRHIGECRDNIDIVIDFSHPSAFKDVTTYCLEKAIPLVMATTGLTEYQIACLKDISVSIPVFHSANMSMGVNLIMELSKIAASFTEGLFDIEIIEKHHNKKLDAPSGTALAIVAAINDSIKIPKKPIYNRHAYRKERDNCEIGIHAVRGGTIVGEHTVLFAGRDEVIEIKHTAMSRDVFASGALKAALFLCTKSAGLYSMRDLILNVTTEVL